MASVSSGLAFARFAASVFAEPGVGSGSPRQGRGVVASAILADHDREVGIAVAVGRPELVTLLREVDQVGVVLKQFGESLDDDSGRKPLAVGVADRGDEELQGCQALLPVDDLAHFEAAVRPSLVLQDDRAQEMRDTVAGRGTVPGCKNVLP